jgi:dienelactone hydrolase
MQTQDIVYRDGDVSLRGFLAYEEAATSQRPGVLVVHEGLGLGDHAMERARMLARLGYVAMAADMFGERRQAHDLQEAQSLTAEFRTEPVRLELARDGADLKAVVSFHGILATKAPARAGTVKPSILVLTGADDPLASADQVAGFEQEMRAAQVQDWQVVSYGNTLHGFTNPAADGSIFQSALYNERSDRRSWAAMQSLFDDVLRGSGQ